MIGMALVAELARTLGGRVSARNVDGERGCEVELRLPSVEQA